MQLCTLLCTDYTPKKPKKHLLSIPSFCVHNLAWNILSSPVLSPTPSLSLSLFLQCNHIRLMFIQDIYVSRLFPSFDKHAHRKHVLHWIKIIENGNCVFCVSVQIWFSRLLLSCLFPPIASNRSQLLRSLSSPASIWFRRRLCSILRLKFLSHCYGGERTFLLEICLGFVCMLRCRLKRSSSIVKRLNPSFF